MRLVPPWEYENPLCKKLGPLYYFAEEDGRYLSAEQKQEIKTLCNSCQHKFDCAEWGINRENWGIWGGLTVSERRSIRRGRGVKPF